MTSLIIDTDPGVDDAFAIALACASPEVDLLAVTTVFGNVPLESTTRNALRLLALCGREDVPVARGAARPLVYPRVQEAEYAHGSDGLSGRAHTLPDPSRDVVGLDAVALMAQILRDAAAPVTIVPIGPLTNIALLLAAHPSLHAKIERLVIMGGGLSGGNTTATAEFNLWSDPEAAHRVLVEERVPTVLVPIDLTFACRVDRAWLSRLVAAGPLGATLAGLTDDYVAHYTKFFGYECTILHDAIAVAEAIRPGLLRTKTYPVEVDSTFGPGRGTLIADRREPDIIATFGAKQARALDIALETDVDEVRAFLLERLATG
ncbi:MAG TPA: nucleoside hydrolase [Actinophytocola sp.]|uniref:nucleoside hydrolase n=1 Tax=Actinophytocola sp. TaxID=1872138 RepID=UPI002DDCB7BC|nr:nucleoside hydrolase [Actinophytocola sp.]HEV2782112.1 nucleoside hydrolase [Actinophytocola sp.]